jgi:hypothetical protein
MPLAEMVTDFFDELKVSQLPPEFLPTRPMFIARTFACFPSAALFSAS